MRPVPETNILALASELFSRTSIIKLPLNVILHAATSTTNSIESASADLKIKSPDNYHVGHRREAYRK